ncbi:MAG: 5-formyltetrahydrofolate cyclo-ligase [Alphaproteobacteria bacterium]|nr:5-formyltetrahydrofolate cyclo-ligase [Alphaproteobacteria bacterium]
MSDVAKAELRSRALAARAAVAQAERGSAAGSLAARGLPFAVVPGSIVAGYSPMRGEIDPSPLMARLRQGGAELALPCVTATGEPLLFRAHAPGQELVRGRYGVAEPAPDCRALTPDVILVPLLAFDAGGQRLGYGAGFYDRTLAELRRSKAVVAVGLAFAMQQVAQVPATSHDVALDYVVTENHWFHFRSGKIADSLCR